MASQQLNLRFDERHHDVVRRVVYRLRIDSGFLEALEALLASDSTPAGGHEAPETLERIARLERRLNALEPRVDKLETVRPAPRARPARETASIPSAPAGSASIPAGGVAGEWTIGEKSKRITPAGRAELDRRLRAGGGITEISRAMGLNRETVRLAKNKLHQSGTEDPPADPL